MDDYGYGDDDDDTSSVSDDTQDYADDDEVDDDILSDFAGLHIVDDTGSEPVVEPDDKIEPDKDDEEE